MLTKADKNWITTTFTTKKEFLLARKEFSAMGTDVSVMQLDMTTLKNGVEDLKGSYSRMEAKVDTVLTKLDKFVGTVATLQQENKMGAITLRRYSVQIEELAKATKTKITK